MMSAITTGDISLTPASSTRRPVAMVAAGAVLLLLLAAAALAPLIAPYDPTVTDLTALYQGSSPRHWLGTDSNGRDLLSRLLWGGRTALVGPLVITALATLAGASLALIAAWRGGWVDATISRAFDLLFSFPGLLLAILAAATFGKGLTAAVIALAVSYSPYMGRIVRGAAVRQAALPYVTALRANGFNGRRVITNHLLPNVRPLIVSQAAILFGYAMIDLAAVSFLGLGVQQPTPDWGAMVASGLPGILAGHPQEALYASIAIVLTVACVNLLGERLADLEGES